MDFLSLLFVLLLIIGLFLFLVGFFIFFAPGLLVKWNAIGNTWLGDPESAKHHATLVRRLFSADYVIFANHRITGVVMWGLASLFFIIYIVYH